ncbi:radical SAM protein [Desulfofustis glycolicus]|uniref:Radical SAM additional 4Fe4S-binding SPASM domain-containing protein n=1 Tax=Desulfofustis glycolicus DSM 9705 TaxID=1121409 RepID=A0A1M5YNF8_9BACT|nr:radical SAM additional 4Fe4S-binding SPASM domain-containing protein [Desulfofustis glycolicus DSM 9705]
MNSYVMKTSRWQGPRSLLPALDIELTERCQNNCCHCCINLPEDDPAITREMTALEIKRILQQAVDLGCLQVRLTGGEPLLRHDFEDIYHYARQLGLRVMLFTNARLITPSLADLFARVPPLLPIEVSVYGMTSATYDAVARIQGAFAEFWQGIESLLQRNVQFIVKWVDLPMNRFELETFQRWAATLPWADQPPGINRSLQLRSRRDAPDKDRLIQSLRSVQEKPLVNEDIRNFCRNFLGPPGVQLFTCGCGEKPCVDAYGRLQPCLDMRAPELSYDLRTRSLRDAMLRFFPALKSQTATDPHYLERCARCFLKSLCEQCPARSWSETGSLDTPVEHLCRITHEQARALGLLAEDERGWKIIDWRNRIDNIDSL